MSLSDISDESSTDSTPPPGKRLRANTLGASSTTSHGSALQESDDENESAENPPPQYNSAQSQVRLINYTEGSPEDARRSSVSENCSSPGEDYRPTFDREPDWPAKGTGDDKFNEKSSDEGSTSNSLETKYNNQAAMRMMRQMGYKTGKGLGKYEHGRTEPVEASTQKGRRGLGLKPSQLGIVPADFKWSPDDAKPVAKEKVSWMPSPPNDDVTADQLEEWLQKGTKKRTIDDETYFCDDNILKGVLGAKTIFDTLDAEDLRKARTRSNPYETIGSMFFLNRAAVKMANIDAVFNFMFTNPRDGADKSMLEKDGLLYFADVCAGPGGFSEYILYRKKWMAKGFGFTLKEQNDFKLSDFYAGPPESFSPYYGIKKDGNIFHPDNLESLRDHVLKQTDDKGVHFLMADGGFSVDGVENLQEVLSKQLYLCQCLAALMLVRTGGHFVVKLFDLFTPFSVSLVYLMYRSFEKVSIHKPVTSRPANSERYLVCKHKRSTSDAIERHLFTVNQYLYSHRDDADDNDITSLTPVDLLQADAHFYKYICISNNELGAKQIKNLLKIAEFCKDKSLVESSQAEMRRQCLELWKLPDQLRTQPQRRPPDETLADIINLMERHPGDARNLHAFKASVLNKPPKLVESSNDLKTFKSIYDWYFQVHFSAKQNNECKFFLGLGGNQVYQLNGSHWQNVVSMYSLYMPAKTLLYGEVVKELMGEGPTQKHTKALHVVDAICLGGTDVSHLSLSERLHKCEIFCRALSKPFDYSVTAIRCKRLFNLEHFHKAMNMLNFRKLKIGPQALTVDIQSRVDCEERFHVVGSLVFFKEVKEPWECTISRSRGTKYYFKRLEDGRVCPKTGSLGDLHPEACVDMLSSLERRLVWYWETASAVYNGYSHEGLKKTEIEQYVMSHTVKVNR